MRDRKTVTEIANELSIDRQRIYRFIKSEMINRTGANDEPMINQVGRVYYCSLEGEQLIRKHFKGNDTQESTINDDQSLNNDQSLDQSSDQSNDQPTADLIDALNRQIDSQEREIERLHRPIDRTQNELEAAQTLQGMQQKLIQDRPAEKKSIFQRIRDKLNSSSSSSDNSDN